MPPRAPPAPGPRPPPRAADVARGSGAAGRHGLPPLALRPWRWLLLLALPAACSALPPPRPVYTNHWAVQVLGGPGAADRVAAAHGYLNLGQIGNLDDYYHFYHSKTFKRSTLSSRGPHTFLRMDPQVKWLQQQEVKRRVKRQARGDSLYFNDPIWSNMWYMHCADKNSRCRSEMNVQAAWKRGYTGKNVVVTILDDGIERNHPDLAPNYDSYASYDVNGNDYDPSPRYDASNENKHGTRCAGEVAASANNSYCIVGIAYNAKIGVEPGGVSNCLLRWQLLASLGGAGEGCSFICITYKECEVREVRSNQLTWRDVQHLLVKTSRPAHLKASDWKVNGAGHKVSHLYGFGLVDAEALVLEARKWTAVPSQHVCVATADKRPRSIPIVQVLRTTALTNACADHSDQRVVYLEHVVVRISISHPRRGDLQIHLISPSGTKSQLLAKRLLDFSNEGFTNWEFMTVHCWGEKAEGEWTLEIQDIPSQVRNPEKQGKLKEWSLILYGTAEHPYRTFSSHQSRSRMLELSVPELEPLKVAGPPPQAETPEDEEEYTAPSTQGSSNTLQTSVCHPECGDKGCDGPNADQCLNCVHFSLGNAKTSRKCVSECPLGYFGDTAARRCRRCHKGCETCTGRSPTQCLSCRRGFYHHQETNTCVTLCPAGLYADESQRHCLKCHPSCQTCVDEPEKCTMCKEGFSLARGSCIPDCEPGTYFDSELIRCGECHHTCRTCVGPSREECIHCAKSFHFQDWKCVPACGEGFYPEEMPGLPHKVCRRCDENCLSCEGSSRNCSRCKAGFAQLGTSCITNHTCSNADETFCEMVKSNRLCERKLFIQFCCRTCLLAG
ncbi:proprotein convertase subtilisin/kexin type 6 [Peromyscus eremicus]|uniref:proprotein convertase subtilisin/kexin type 6 n=1 Tax=Peromyscus eremicus TaxID=42410 RepID=UPI0027DBE6CA|nr:proprotein convertase subtilisin/kexin type 6 [Peromyscus eremicus]